MNLKKIKREIFYLKKAFLEYHQGWSYLKNRYFLAPKILKLNKILEKPINNHDLSIHVLTGQRDLILLIWALASFYNVAENIGQLYVHSDGSLSDYDIKLLNKFFPSAKIIDPNIFVKEYASQLDQYPIIKKFRTNYPDFFLVKKLIDPYFVSNRPKRLIIDSDLLWFKTPKIIDQSISGESRSLMMQGVLVGEGNFVRFKDGSKLSHDLAHFNSGIVLYHKHNFDLKKLVEYFEKIDDQVKSNRHFIEQAGYAYCLKDLVGLPQDQYQIKGKLSDATVVKHFTAPRRLLFYTEGLEIMKDKFLN